MGPKGNPNRQQLLPCRGFCFWMKTMEPILDIMEEFEEAKRTAAMLIKGMGHQGAYLYIVTHPGIETLEETLVASIVKVAIVQQMREELRN